MRISHARYLIVDVEATCSDDGQVPREEMEIIEIGAVIQDAATYEIESEFQTFIRPVQHTRLTDFCVQLTGITTEDLAGAPAFAQAIAQLNAWKATYDDALFCSWGDYDRQQFHQDCAHHGVSYPFGPEHLNLKAEFSRALGQRKTFGISGALKHVGLSFEGTPHRGLDDTKNIARIVRRVCAGI